MTQTESEANNTQGAGSIIESSITNSNIISGATIAAAARPNNKRNQRPSPAYGSPFSGQQNLKKINLSSSPAWMSRPASEIYKNMNPENVQDMDIDDNDNDVNSNSDDNSNIKNNTNNVNKPKKNVNEMIALNQRAFAAKFSQRKGVNKNNSNDSNNKNNYCQDQQQQQQQQEQQHQNVPSDNNDKKRFNTTKNGAVIKDKTLNSDNKNSKKQQIIQNDNGFCMEDITTVDEPGYGIFDEGGNNIDNENKVITAAKKKTKKSSLSSKGCGGKWTAEEDQKLRAAVAAVGPQNWKLIAQEFLGEQRSDVQCLHRWQKVLQPGLVKGPWTKEEDQIIVGCIDSGITKWSEIAEKIPGRIGKQCRERWFNHLDPTLKKGGWTEEEDNTLVDAQAKWGNSWTKIAKLLPGRSENAVKNRWNSATRRRAKAANRSNNTNTTNSNKSGKEGDKKGNGISEKRKEGTASKESTKSDKDSNLKSEFHNSRSKQETTKDDSSVSTTSTCKKSEEKKSTRKSASKKKEHKKGGTGKNDNKLSGDKDTKKNHVSSKVKSELVSPKPKSKAKAKIDKDGLPVEKRPPGRPVGAQNKKGAGGKAGAAATKRGRKSKSNTENSFMDDNDLQWTFSNPDNINLSSHAHGMPTDFLKDHTGAFDLSGHHMKSELHDQYPEELNLSTSLLHMSLDKDILMDNQVMCQTFIGTPMMSTQEGCTPTTSLDTSAFGSCHIDNRNHEKSNEVSSPYNNFNFGQQSSFRERKPTDLCVKTSKTKASEFVDFLVSPTQVQLTDFDNQEINHMHDCFQDYSYLQDENE